MRIDNAIEGTCGTTRIFGTVRGERRTKFKDDDGKTRTRVEEIEADIEVDINNFDIVLDLGRRAIRNKSGKAAEMSGTIKARAIRPRTLSNRII